MILFYGALGEAGTTRRIGGGETGNRKTIGYLKRIGFDVFTISKPYPDNEKRFRGVHYAALLFEVFLAFTRRLLTDPSVRDVHVSGFYMHLIYHECALIWMSKIFRKKVVYELRGSGVQRGYDQRSWVYRAFFRCAVANADSILCQGSRYLPFIRELTDRPVIHYPNCNELYHQTRSSSSKIISAADVVRMIYFGRMVESKRPDISIKVCNDLRLRGIDARLDIVGSGDASYLEYLRGIAQSLGIGESVSFHPPMDIADLVGVLAVSHFFVFPSQEEREGQSNALTEAMALGVVPVVSSIGFNAEVVGDESLVVHSNSPSAYSDIIIEIIESGTWKQLSNNAISRVENIYSEDVALSALCSVYCS